MQIALDASFFSSSKEDGYEFFLQQLFTSLIAQYPDDQFILFFDDDIPLHRAFASNTVLVPLKSSPNGNFLQRWQYKRALFSSLKKYNASIYISGNGRPVFDLLIPQLYILYDLRFIHRVISEQKRKAIAEKTLMPIKNTRSVVVPSSFVKNQLTNNFQFNSEHVQIVKPAITDIFQPVSDWSRKIIKEKYTADCEFFLYAGILEESANLRNLLKAFSLFKKRQQTTWKLVLLGRTSRDSGTLLNSLSSYKYRNDVVIADAVSELDYRDLIGSAYALVYPPLHEGFGKPVLEALRCNTPVITIAGSAMQELAADAALYTDGNDPANIAEKMMLLYKDERMRNWLISKGTEQSAGYSWKKAAFDMYQIIRQTVS